MCGKQCPVSKFCQQCGSDKIKSTCVDFLEMKEYHEIDLDEEPCIFPDCGHFLTVSSIDGQMDMAAHYSLDENGFPTAVSGASLPFSDDAARIRACPSCRGSLRNISRYGRIMRRGLLDESTKKFISWSASTHLELAQQLVEEQKKLQEAPPPSSSSIRSAGKPTASLSIKKPRLRNICHLQQLSKTPQRYVDIVKLWMRISSFSARV